jgi:hypothetical protein
MSFSMLICIGGSSLLRGSGGIPFSTRWMRTATSESFEAFGWGRDAARASKASNESAAQETPRV